MKGSTKPERSKKYRKHRRGRYREFKSCYVTTGSKRVFQFGGEAAEKDIVYKLGRPLREGTITRHTRGEWVFCEPIIPPAVKRTNCTGQTCVSDFNLTPLDVGFDLRVCGIHVMLPENFSNAAVDIDGETWLLEGPRDKLIQEIRKAGYVVAEEVKE